jgi:hypothetical protein
MSSESIENSSAPGWSGADRGPPLYEIAVFLAALAAFALLLPFGSFDTIIGDNICQVGYWRILFDRAFVGSLGASSMKPGLIVLLGSVHDLSMALLGSTSLIKAVFALSGAALATIVARIARETGGTIAGVGAVVYLLSATPVPGMFTFGTSMLVFIPLVLTGVWSFSRQRETAGAVFLCLAALIRIEAFAVLLWLAIAEQLLRRKWRPFSISAAAAVVAVVITVLVYYRVQGSFARFNAGGPPAGYIFSRDPSVVARFLHALEYTASASSAMLLRACGFPYLGIPALLGWALSPARRFYLSLLGIPLFLIVYISAGQGSSEVRYFEFLTPFVAAFGAAGIAHGFRIGKQAESNAARWLWPLSGLAGVACFVLDLPTPLRSVSVLFIAAGISAVTSRLPFVLPSPVVRAGWALVFAGALLGTLNRGGWGKPPGPATFTREAQSLVRDPPIPRGQRVLLDDDVLYGVLIRDRALFREARTLQFLNVQNDAGRAQMLGATDYIIVSRGPHGYYYLKYDPLRTGRSDPLRAAILAARRSKASNVYGYRLVPVKASRQLLVLKVEKA